MKNYKGGCHCGAVRYEASADIEKVIECNCSHCSAKGLLLSFIPADSFTLQSGEEKLTEYHFNKGTITHLFCEKCGVESFARGIDANGHPMAALNVRCFDDVDLSAFERMPFDGKSY